MSKNNLESNRENHQNKKGMKKYLTYLFLLVISLMGTDLTDFALSLWVLGQSELGISSYTQILFFEALPAVALAPFIGSFVDRWNKKKMIIYGQLVAGLGSIVLMTLFYLEQLLPWHIMIIVSIGSVASMFIYTSFFVSSRALVSKKELIKAQGMAAMLFAVVEVGVPIIAPFLYDLIGIGNIFLIDFVTFLVPLTAFLILKFVVVPRSEEKFNIKNDFKLAFSFIKERKGLTSLIVFAFLFSAFYSAVQALFAPLILDFSDENTLGKVMAFTALGTLIGGAVMSDDREYKNPVRAMGPLYFFMGVILSALVFQVGLYTIAIAGMIVVLLFTIKETLDDAFILTIVPVHMQGRISGVLGLVIGLSGPVSILFSGVLVDVIEPLIDKNQVTFLNHLPGTVTTTSIMIVIGLAGILMALIAIVFWWNNGIKQLGVLYRSDLKKDADKESEEENIEKIEDKLKEELIKEL